MSLQLHDAPVEINYNIDENLKNGWDKGDYYGNNIRPLDVLF